LECGREKRKQRDSLRGSNRLGAGKDGVGKRKPIRSLAKKGGRGEGTGVLPKWRAIAISSKGKRVALSRKGRKIRDP